MTKTKPLRESMPQTAALIDDLRRVFGAGGINDSIRRGMNREPMCFYARENGIEIGTKTPKQEVWSEDQIREHYSRRRKQ